MSSWSSLFFRFSANPDQTTSYSLIIFYLRLQHRVRRFPRIHVTFDICWNKRHRRIRPLVRSFAGTIVGKRVFRCDKPKMIIARCLAENFITRRFSSVNEVCRSCCCQWRDNKSVLPIDRFY